MRRRIEVQAYWIIVFSDTKCDDRTGNIEGLSRFKENAGRTFPPEINTKSTVAFLT